MRLAFYTYSYTDRMKMPIPECLRQIAKAGYTGIDVSGTHGPSDDPRSFDADRRRETRDTADRLGLRVEAVITHATLTETLFDPQRSPLDLKGSVELAAELSARVVTFHMGGYPAGTDKPAVWQRVVETIKPAADFAAARHVELAVDGIWPTWIVDSPDALDSLIHDVQPLRLGVNLDPSYLTLMGVDPSRFISRFHKSIVHGHLKDHQGEYPKWTHKIPGSGQMDYVAVWRALERVSFRESLAVECFTDMPFAKACDEGYLAMAEAAKQAGVTLAE